MDTQKPFLSAEVYFALGAGAEIRTNEVTKPKAYGITLSKSSGKFIDHAATSVTGSITIASRSGMIR
jgi:hypothetical protein